MKITMNTTVPGSIDGIRVSSYEEGIEYVLTGSDGARDLAAAFVGAGYATEVSAKKSAPVADPAPVSAAVEGEQPAPVKAPKKNK